MELVFYCDVLLLQDYTHPARSASPGSAIDTFCHEIGRRADRACDVLLQAEKLRAVTVSWIDTTGYNAAIATWSGDGENGLENPLGRKCTILAPLRKLLQHPKGKGPITLKIGQVNGPAREWFVRAMGDTVGERSERECPEGSEGGVRRSASSSDGANDDREQAAKLRMLAFDVRQDRHLLHREQEEALYWGRGFLDRPARSQDTR